MKINCELPNCLLESNNELNEYDFVLFHLYQSDPIYKKYYVNNYQKRLTILDNSAYEFFIKGEILNLREYLEVIDELKPTYYILPDKLMNKDYTIEKTIEFLEEYSPQNTYSKPMAVIQGNTPKEMIECLEEYIKLGIEAIAIPFHNSFYLDYKVSNEVKNDFCFCFMDITKDHKYAMGRVQFIKDYSYMLKKFKHVHILGSHCPVEKIYYNDFQTMDTGYPVKCGIAGYKLFEEPEKPEIIIDEFLNEELTKQTKTLIISNIEEFKRL